MDIKHKIVTSETKDGEEIQDEITALSKLVLSEATRLVDDKKIFQSEVSVISGLMSVLTQYMSMMIGYESTASHLEDCKSLTLQNMKSKLN